MLKSLVAQKDRNQMTESELNKLTHLQKYNSLLIRKKVGRVSRYKKLLEVSEMEF